MTDCVDTAPWRIERQLLGPTTEAWRSILRDGAPLTFGEVFALWGGDARFRAFWHAQLRAAPFASFCWECPPVTRGGLGAPFECVLVDSPLLARMPADPHAFAEHFVAGFAAVAFGNLGGDALLVAPCPDGAGTSFAHLAVFCASASPSQASALWLIVGAAVEERLGDRPLWLSTAGLGVGWLHVRLDDRPKYYRHAPYRAGA